MLLCGRCGRGGFSGLVPVRVLLQVTVEYWYSRYLGNRRRKHGVDPREQCDDYPFRSGNGNGNGNWVGVWDMTGPHEGVCLLVGRMFSWGKKTVILYDISVIGMVELG